jgi:phosphatidylserine decarboxylase
MERDFTPDDPGFTDFLKVWPQYLLPTHLLSRVVYAATRIRVPFIKNLMIRRFMRAFGVTLREAQVQDATAFEHFNAFFTRALLPDARPVVADADAVASPVDGTVSQAGRIDNGRIFQAKGQSFSLVELLGGMPGMAAPFMNGNFATLYLAPYNYHRIHMPLDGTLKRMAHIPGRLFSVNRPTVRRLPRVFARNERVACVFDTDAGPMAVVMVGALFVGSIETPWAGEVTPPMGRRVTNTTYTPAEAPRFDRGGEIGRFNMGSTVILLFGPDAVEWHERLGAGMRVQLGERIGSV